MNSVNGFAKSKLPNAQEKSYRLPSIQSQKDAIKHPELQHIMSPLLKEKQADPYNMVASQRARVQGARPSAEIKSTPTHINETLDSQALKRSLQLGKPLQLSNTIPASAINPATVAKVSNETSAF